MLNQPKPSLFPAATSSAAELAPAGRFRLLFAVFVVAVLIVLTRIGWVQSQLGPRYLQALQVTTIEYELLPARDGRILADTTVLAADEDRYAVQVHYRWLQQPADERWVERHVRSELTREERQDPALVDRLKQSRLQQQTHLWQQLSETIGAPKSELQRQRTRVQQRVQRIADDVNRRRLQRAQQSDVARNTSVSPEFGARLPRILVRLASAVRQAVTSPPRRRIDDRIVVREEEDFHTVLNDIPLALAAEIRANPQRFPGTRVRVTTRRSWPQATLAAHVVGARTTLTDAEQREQQSDVAVTPDSWLPRTGRSGVEYAWDHRLRGTAGLRKTVRNRRMQIVESAIVRNPLAGKDVQLTLHPTLQQHVEQLLADALQPQESHAADSDDGDRLPVPTGGCAVLMDIQDGRLLVAASAPTFDLSLFQGGTAADWAAVNADPRQPFLSRITSAALPPGSVFKPVTAAAALEGGQIQPDSPFYCQGYLINPREHRCLIFRSNGSSHQDITLHRALAQSCNVYFFDAASRAGLRPLSDWSRRFGFGAPTGVDLPFERSGVVPRAPAAIDSAAQRARIRQQALGLAIGQARLTTTPLQVVRMMAAIANGGWLVVPHVATLEGVARRADETSLAPRNLSRRRIQGLQEETLRAIREGLVATVQQPYGTGYQFVRLDGVKIAGKSGTAETSVEGRNHAWFAGYVPAERPQFAFTVVLENGGSGSRAAGTVVQAIIRRMLQASLL